MNRFAVIGAAMALLVAEPALADDYFAVPPSGQTETVFDAPVAATTDRLASKCMDAHWTVINTTETSVVCEAPMSFGQSLLGSMLMGSKYSTPPKTYYRFNVAGVQGVSRVQANGWMELQSAFGQTRRNEFSGPGFHNGMMNFMVAAGGRLPPGTTFPNHVLMGLEFDTISKAGAVVKTVEEGPAKAAGLMPADVIVKMAGKTLKSENDWMDAASKAKKTDTYPVEIVRGGAHQTLSVARAFRAAVAAPNPAAIAPQLAASASAPPPAALSLADELAKFAKLRDAGVITKTEFEAQKAKLLSRN